MSGHSGIPGARLRVLWDHPPSMGGDFVLYWMIATRRARWNYALDRAVALAHELEKPLVVLEALRAGHRFASDRLHKFALDGMRANQAAFADTHVAYFPYVEPEAGAGRGLLAALAERAAAVVTDDSPAYFLPAMVASARLDVRMRFEAVDSNGLLPLRAAPKAFVRALDFRRFLQRELTPHLAEPPRENALACLELPRARIPAELTRRWPQASARLLRAEPDALAALRIDHSVAATALEGGSPAGERVLKRFLTRLERYAEDKNHPDQEATSGLSPYLHFGHVSAHQVFERLAANEGWTSESLGAVANGKREGWWGMSAPAEAFLDQLVTWRELGFNGCAHGGSKGHWESLPAWARATLEKHAGDERPEVYDDTAFEAGETHDELWNAAQNQLRAEGRIPGYLRMLWGKKVLHWSRDPRAALALLFELNDRYALDGRDPNSISGILWTFGKYDRPWPEREVFGTVRSMTSASARRKLRLDDYLVRWRESGSASVP